MERRVFIKNSSLLVSGLIGLSYFNNVLSKARITPKNILLRVEGKNLSLEEMIRMPSMVRLIQKNIPGADLTLWPAAYNQYLVDLIGNVMTKVKVADGDILMDGTISDPQLEETLKKTDLLFLTGMKESEILIPNDQIIQNLPLIQYCQNNNIPVAFHPFDLPAEMTPSLQALPEGLGNINYIFTTSSQTEKRWSSLKLKSGKISNASHYGLFFDLQNDAMAMNFFSSAGLIGKEYLLLSPDFFPYQNNLTGVSQSLSVLVTRWISETKNPVLLMNGHDEVNAKNLTDFFNNLPPETKSKVIPGPSLPFPDEALSYIDKSRIVISNDPAVIFLAIGSRVPVIYLNSSEEDVCHFSLKDLGLEKWSSLKFPDVPESPVEMMMGIHKNYVDSLILVDKAVDTGLRLVKSAYSSLNSDLEKRVKIKIKSAAIKEKKNPK